MRIRRFRWRLSFLRRMHAAQAREARRRRHRRIHQRQWYRWWAYFVAWRAAPLNHLRVNGAAYVERNIFTSHIVSEKRRRRNGVNVRGAYHGCARPIMRAPRSWLIYDAWGEASSSHGSSV